MAGARSLSRFFLLVITVACFSPPTDVAGLAGTYVMTYGTDTLRLDSAGRYRRVQIFNTPGGVHVDSGPWELMQHGRLVALRDFAQRLPAHGTYDPNRGWHATDTTTRKLVALPVDATWSGKTVLGVRPEIGWRYVRVGKR